MSHKTDCPCVACAFMRVFGYRPVVATIALVAGCGLPPESARRVADCAAYYASCVETSDTMTQYRECRAEVDALCLDDDGGAP